MIHYSNNFISSKVHSELVKEIYNLGDTQNVLVPVRSKLHFGVNDPEYEGVNVSYFRYPNLLRFFPLIKLIFIFIRGFGIFRHVLRVEPKGSRCVAHNFWSDGVPVFLYSLVFDFQYLLVVRNTDINFFIPKLLHYRWLMKWMVRRSGGLVFVSRAHKDRFEKKWPKLFEAARKVAVIPNGVDDFWHINQIETPVKRPVRACFVGNFNANKNVRRMIDASKLILEDFPEFQLVLVGGSESELLALLDETAVPEFVVVKGKISSKKELAQVFRDARVFLMPSLTETFGLVFIEAMSQGCALICSRGEGIDGMFEEPYVQSVQPLDVQEIALALKKMLRNFESGCPVEWSAKQLNQFKWENVAHRYQGFL